MHFEVVKSGELARDLLLMLINVNYLLSGSSISIFILVLHIYVSLGNKSFISMTRFYLQCSCFEESKAQKKAKIYIVKAKAQTKFSDF